MIIAVVFFSILVAVTIGGVVPFSQWKPPLLFKNKNFYMINIKNFKRKKIKRLSFLFRGLYGTDVKKYGVIYPMYIMHIIGFFIAIASVIMSVVLYYFTNLGWNVVVIEVFIMMGFDCVYFVVVDICGRLSKRRDKQRDKTE